MKRSVAGLSCLALAASLALAGCSGDEDDGPKIIVYNAQHLSLIHI